MDSILEIQPPFQSRDRLSYYERYDLSHAWVSISYRDMRPAETAISRPYFEPHNI